jgi:uncharacterized membrane protein
MNRPGLMKTLTKEVPISLWAILLTAAYLRLDGFSAWSLTNDELSAVYGLSFPSLSETLSVYVYDDMHPAGVQLFMYFWCKLFGQSVFSIRLPFVLMGIASVCFLYASTRNFFGQQAGLIAAAMLAVLQYPILFSQLARPYSMGLFAVLLCAQGWSSIITRDVPIKKDYFLFTTGMVIAMYNHYFSFLTVALMGLFGFGLMDKTKWKWFSLCGLIAVLTYLPHLPISIAQFSRGGLGTWLGPPDEDFYKQFLLYAFNDSFIFLVMVLAIAWMGWIMTPTLKIIRNKILVCAFLFLLPFLIAYYYSIHVNPVLQNSILLFGFPFLLMVISSSVGKIKMSFANALTGLILISGIYTVKAVNNFKPEEQFGTFSKLAERIIEVDNTYGANNITHTMNIVNPFYLDYYLNPQQHPNHFVMWQNKGREELSAFKKIVENSSTDYFLYCWTNSDNPQELHEIIKERYPFLIERNWWFNSEFYLYARHQEQNYDLDTIHFYTRQDYESEHPAWSLVYERLDSVNYRFGKHCEWLAPGFNYSSTYSNIVQNVVTETSDIFHASVWFRLVGDSSDAQLAVSIQNNADVYLWRSTPLRIFEIKKGDWNLAYLSFRLPEFKTQQDELRVYVTQGNDSQGVYLDNLSIKLTKGNPIVYGKRKVLKEIKQKN